MSDIPAGYELVEFQELDPLARRTVHHGLAWALLCWLAEELQQQFDPQRVEIEIAAIKAKYIGPYPAMGIRYLTSETFDDACSLSVRIREAGKALLDGDRLGHFICFAAESEVQWETKFAAATVPGHENYEVE